jgi:hypothetical protein
MEGYEHAGRRRGAYTGVVMAGAEAAASIAMIGMVSEGGDMDGTDNTGVQCRVVGWQAKRGNRKHLLGQRKPT